MDLVSADNGKIAKDINKTRLGRGKTVRFETPRKEGGGENSGGRISLAGEGAFESDADDGESVRRRLLFFSIVFRGARGGGFFVRKEDFPARIEH